MQLISGLVMWVKTVSVAYRSYYIMVSGNGSGWTRTPPFYVGHKAFGFVVLLVVVFVFVVLCVFGAIHSGEEQPATDFSVTTI